MDVATIISDLNDHGFTDTSTNTKVRAIQDTIWEIESVRPWPFLETSATLSYDGTGPTPVTAPPRFRSVLKVMDVSTGAILQPVRLDDVEAIVGTQLNMVAAPRMYYVEGGVFKVWPVPPNGTSLRLRYLQHSAAITDSSPESAILLPARHHRAIVYGALVRLYDMEDDPELASRFEQHYENRLQKIVDDLFRQQYDRPERVYVTDPDSYDEDDY